MARQPGGASERFTRLYREGGGEIYKRSAVRPPARSQDRLSLKLHVAFCFPATSTGAQTARKSSIARNRRHPESAELPLPHGRGL